MRYNNGVNQYTEKEMTRRVWRLLPRIMRKRGFDILLTHAPGKGMVDCHDLCHTGFETFNKLLDKYQPALFLHGHTHLNYGRNIPRESRYGQTRVVNGYERLCRGLFKGMKDMEKQHINKFMGRHILGTRQNDRKNWMHICFFRRVALFKTAKTDA